MSRMLQLFTEQLLSFLFCMSACTCFSPCTRTHHIAKALSIPECSVSQLANNLLLFVTHSQQLLTGTRDAACHAEVWHALQTHVGIIQTPLQTNLRETVLADSVPPTPHNVMLLPTVYRRLRCTTIRMAHTAWHTSCPQRANGCCIPQ